jgi:hypothetical protein
MKKMEGHTRKYIKKGKLRESRGKAEQVRSCFGASALYFCRNSS